MWALMDGSTVLYAVGAKFQMDGKTPAEVPVPGSMGVMGDGYTWMDIPRGLFDATCPDLGLVVSFHCIKDEMCQTFGYCMLSSERLTVELETFRDGEDLVMPLCEIAEALENDPDNNVTEGSAAIVAMIGAYTPKVVADKDRLEYVIDMTAFRHTADGHYLHQELFRDGSDFRIRVREMGVGTPFEM